jgi:hypothetical protein
MEKPACPGRDTRSAVRIPSTVQPENPKAEDRKEGLPWSRQGKGKKKEMSKKARPSPRRFPPTQSGETDYANFITIP